MAAARASIEQVGYRSFLTVESGYGRPKTEGGDRAYLEGASSRADLIISGQ